MKNGDEVAILPHNLASPSEVSEIAIVQHAGPLFIQLQDGRRFATLGGAGLNCSGCLVEAGTEHREALAKMNGRGETDLAVGDP